MKRFFVNLWRNKNAGWRLARIVILLAAGASAYVVMFESRFIYFPSKYPEGDWREGAEAGGGAARCEDVWLAAEDGVRLHAWFCAPRAGRDGATEPAAAADRAVLFLHGNAGNISHRRDQIESLAALPASVFIIDYRGYGRSEGSPGEQGLYRDARAAWEHLTKARGFPPGRVVVYGESLGGAVAVDLASRARPCALVLQSTFTSIADMAAEVMPFVPRFIIRTKMDSLEKMARVKSPVLVVHSPADEIVPYKFGRRLYEAAPEPKQFHEITNAPHNLTHDIGGAAYYAALREFIDSACG
ncbi:MAG: alpha/beta hydrolase [Acidobacteria bacterium]|nr:alpha/beta hydrolase [Acidobacteriota bacterium]